MEELDFIAYSKLKRLEIVRIEIENGTLYPNEDEWKLLEEFPLPEFAEYLIDLYVQLEKSMFTSETNTEEEVNYYLDQLSYYLVEIRDTAIEIVYSKLQDENLNGKARKDLIDISNRALLFSIDSIKKLLESEKLSDNKLAVDLVFSESTWYSKNDIVHLRRLKDLFIQVFPKSEEYMKKRKIGSKEDPVWRCTCGNEVSTEKEYCSCGLDRYRFSHKEIHVLKAIDEIKLKMKVLEDFYSGKYSEYTSD